MKFKKRFTSRLFLTNTVIVVLLLFCVLFYFYRFFREKEEAKYVETMQTITTKVKEQADMLIDNMDQVALQIASNPYMVSELSGISKDPYRNYFNDNYFKRFEVQEFLNSYNFKNDLATRICVYDSGSNFVNVGYKQIDDMQVQKFLKSQKFQNLENYFQADSSRGLFVPPQKDYFGIKPRYGSQLRIFAVVRPVKSYTASDETVYGFVEVQLTEASLKKIFDSLPSNFLAYIVNVQNAVIFPVQPDSARTDIRNADQSKYFITSAKMNESNYRIVLMQNKNLLFDSYRKMQYIVIVIFIIVLAVSGVTQLILIRYFTRPLKQLEQSVEAINLNNLSLNLLDQDVNNEFLQLNWAFSKMFDHLNESIQQEITAKTGALKSQFLALQAQIDPHFIHNILMVMSVIAEEHHVPKIEHMCAKLSSMLRFSASYKSMYVTLADELEYTAAYLELMQERYENMFLFELDTDPGAKMIEVPKLIIQPLAENCFRHGFHQTPVPWKILIGSRTGIDTWKVVIEDNGSGFKTDFLRDFSAYKSGLKNNPISEHVLEDQIGGLGLKNIYQRLFILYGEELIFELRNRPEGGALIMIGGKIRDAENTGSRG